MSKFDLQDGRKLSDILDFIIKKFKRDDFVFTKLYKVKNHFKNTRGKWSSAISNSVFLDSKKFHIVYANMFFKRFKSIMKRSMMDGDLNIKQLEGIDIVTDLMHEYVNGTDISDFAFRAVIKGEDSHKQYIQDPYWPQKAATKLMSINKMRHDIENKFLFETILSESLINSQFVTLMYQYSVLLIFFIMIFLAFIVSNSLIQSSIDQKQYESAMLRILGWNKKYIVIVTILKSLLFNILPGATMGLLIASKIIMLLKDVIL